jgi:methionyl-tRNA formyltransferase
MTSSSPRVLFMGTPEFAVPTLKGLIQNAWNVVAVYTQPPRPKGRGHQLQKSPVHLFAEGAGLPVHTWDRLREEAVAELKAYEPDVIIVAAYGLILPQRVLDIPRQGCLNLHASLLPRWRGAAPIQRALLAGDLETGVTLMQMDAGMDTGGIFAMHPCPVRAETTTASLTQTLAEEGATFLCAHLGEILEGKRTARPQPENGVLYAPKISKEEGLLCWESSAPQLERQVRALNAWFCQGSQRIRVHEARVAEDTSVASGPVGEIVDDALWIRCGEQTLFQPGMLTPEGGKRMSLEDFLRGYGADFPKGRLL